MASASVENKSMGALSASEDLYRAAKRTTKVASGELQQTKASRAKGLTTCRGGEEGRIKPRTAREDYGWRYREIDGQRDQSDSARTGRFKQRPQNGQAENGRGGCREHQGVNDGSSVAQCFCEPEGCPGH